MRFFVSLCIFIVEWLAFPWDDWLRSCLRSTGEFYLGMTGRWSYGSSNSEEDEWKAEGVGCFIWCLILLALVAGLIVWLAPDF